MILAEATPNRGKQTGLASFNTLDHNNFRGKTSANFRFQNWANWTYLDKQLQQRPNQDVNRLGGFDGGRTGTVSVHCGGGHNCASSFQRGGQWYYEERQARRSFDERPSRGTMTPLAELVQRKRTRYGRASNDKKGEGDNDAGMGQRWCWCGMVAAQARDGGNETEKMMVGSSRSGEATWLYRE